METSKQVKGNPSALFFAKVIPANGGIQQKSDSHLKQLFVFFWKLGQ